MDLKIKIINLLILGKFKKRKHTLVLKLELCRNCFNHVNKDLM